MLPKKLGNPRAKVVCKTHHQSRAHAQTTHALSSSKSNFRQASPIQEARLFHTLSSYFPRTNSFLLHLLQFYFCNIAQHQYCHHQSISCTIHQIIVAIAKIWGPLVDKQSANPFSIALVYNIFASSNNTIISLPSP